MARPLRLSLLLLCSLLPVLAACDDGGVLAKVGKSRLQKADLDLFQASRGGPQHDPSGALRALAERTLLAEGARRRGLQDDERVRARLAAAEREVLGQALLDDAAAPLVTDEVLRARFEKEREKLARRQVHVASLMVVLPRGQGPLVDNARAKVQKLYGRAVAGEPFEVLCKEGSEDPASVARGCDQGLLQEGQVDATFFNAAVALKRGAVSPPVETSFGLFVIRALEDPSVVQPTFEQARARLEVAARREGEEKLIAELHERIGVELHEDRLKKAPAEPQPVR